MWLAITIPIVIVAVGIATVPLLVNSVRFHRWHHRPSASRRPTQRPRRIRCPLCAAEVVGTTPNQVVAARNQHFLEEHATSRTVSVELEQRETQRAG